jgi:hypothetical protein
MPENSRMWIRRGALGAAAGALLLSAIGFAAWKWRYPYGFNHCCDKQIVLGLRQYAETNGGRFPAGEITPEASLSLLYPNLCDAYILRGKTKPLEPAEAILGAGGRLTPETCDWHYVEGLTLDDDGRLAIFWEKIGLGHNGERLPPGAHSVGFVGGYTDVVYDWPAFLAEQAKLHAARGK